MASGWHTSIYPGIASGDPTGIVGRHFHGMGVIRPSGDPGRLSSCGSRRFPLLSASFLALGCSGSGRRGTRAGRGAARGGLWISFLSSVRRQKPKHFLTGIPTSIPPLSVSPVSSTGALRVRYRSHITGLRNPLCKMGLAEYSEARLDTRSGQVQFRAADPPGAPFGSSPAPERAAALPAR